MTRPEDPGGRTGVEPDGAIWQYGVPMPDDPDAIDGVLWLDGVPRHVLSRWVRRPLRPVGPWRPAREPYAPPMTRPEDLAIPDLTDAEAAAFVALAEGRQPQPRPEDFYVTTRLLCCPVDGCPWHQAIGNWPGDLDGDLGSLLAAARDHLTNHHPNQPE